jgi:galactose mutarotase-like enzyme
MTILKNDYISVKISNVGAELLSLYDIERQTEILWQQEGGLWDYTSPLLFPVIGECFQNQYLCHNEIYSTPRHGFARITSFELISASKASASFLLTQNEQTLKQYPFNFELTLDYILDGKKCIMRSTVINPGPDDLPFQLGYHPGFRFDLSDLEQCYILFDREEPQFPHMSTPTRLDISNIPMGERNTYIAYNPNSDFVTMVTPEYRVKIGIEDFTRLAIWRKTKDMPFVCIEPQIGGGDSKDVLTNIFERMGGVVLKKAQQFSIQAVIQCE